MQFWVCCNNILTVTCVLKEDQIAVFLVVLPPRVIGTEAILDWVQSFCNQHICEIVELGDWWLLVRGGPGQWLLIRCLEHFGTIVQYSMPSTVKTVSMLVLVNRYFGTQWYAGPSGLARLRLLQTGSFRQNLCWDEQIGRLLWDCLQAVGLSSHCAFLLTQSATCQLDK